MSTVTTHSTADSTAERVLILGASGRFGRAASEAFYKAGWQVVGQFRPGKQPKTYTGNIINLEIAERASLAKAAEGCSVIVNALNPPYPAWKDELPGMTAAVLNAARSSGASIAIPGNIYNYGTAMPPVLSHTTPHKPDTKKGRLREEMETTYRQAAAAGVQTIILRCGDFLERTPTGNWFDTYMANNVGKGTFTYPGNPQIDHAWAYLPDAARALVLLCEKRSKLDTFADISFPGTTASGEQLRLAIEQLTGKSIRMKTIPWGLMKLMALFHPLMRELMEMRYLWDVPHRMDETQLADILPGFQATSLNDILIDCLNKTKQQTVPQFSKPLAVT